MLYKRSSIAALLLACLLAFPALAQTTAAAPSPAPTVLVLHQSSNPFAYYGALTGDPTLKALGGNVWAPHVLVLATTDSPTVTAFLVTLKYEDAGIVHTLVQTALRGSPSPWASTAFPVTPGCKVRGVTVVPLGAVGKAYESPEV